MFPDLLRPDRPLCDVHFFQDPTYKEIHRFSQWSIEPFDWTHGPLRYQAMVMTRTLRLFPGSVSMIMFGPRIDYHDEPSAHLFFSDLLAHVRSSGSLYLAMQPYVFDSEELRARLGRLGFEPKAKHILYAHTVCVDLDPSEDEIFASFDGQLRKAIRKAEKNGVEVRVNESDACVGIFYDLYRQAYRRSHGAYQSRDYFQRVWDVLVPKREALFAIAYVGGKPASVVLNAFASGNMLFLSGGSCSDDVLMKERPNEKLHWDMIRLAKQWGCRFYDFGGANPRPAPGSKSMGITAFKRKFSDEVRPLLGYYRHAFNPLIVEGLDLMLPWATRLRRVFSKDDVTEYNLL